MSTRLRAPGHVLAFLVLAGCTAPARSASKAKTAGGGTSEMAAALKERMAAVDPLKTQFLVNDRRAKLFAGELEAAPSLPIQERLRLRLALARELLHAGRIEESLQALDALEDDAKASAPAVWEAQRSGFEILRATAYLRMGEEQNCHQGNTPDSCLLPLRGEGIHRRREGSTRAAEVLVRVLEEFPDNLQARWLLNIAHMTLGTYPDGVPRRHLIPPAVFESGYPLPRFENVARRAGIDVYALSGGAILDDFDRDGHLDLVLSAMGYEDPMRYLRGRGDGTFEDRTAQSGLGGETGGLNMTQADYDNDGLVDVLVLRGGWLKTEGRFPMSLLRNEGGGRFQDVTRAAGLFRLAPTQTATWLDYDGDGWLDLYVGNETAKDSPEPHPCELFHNNGDGTFTDVARQAGVEVVGYVKGVVSGDYNNDRRPDLYVSVLAGENLLFRNDGPGPGGAWRFTNVASTAGVTEPLASFGAFFFDYDNDGWPDLFVAGFNPNTTAGDVAADYLGVPVRAPRGRLYRNRGDGTFEDTTQAAGVFKVIPTMGLNFGDLDNDGWLDFYLGTGNPDLGTLVPNRMFRNAGGRVFQDVTTAGNFGHLQKGHAICFGDVDEDGDQDVFEEMGGAYQDDKAYSALYQNPGNANHWLVLDLEGVRSNRRAMGARLKVTVETKAGSRVLYRTVGSGGSFGASPLRQEIGLGEATAISSVEIQWPGSGATQTLEGLQLDHRYQVREGQQAVAAEGQRPVAAAGGSTTRR
jgi:FG-GAP-like repeat/ASPIC and UnbV